jgi:hypothetical protein
MSFVSCLHIFLVVRLVSISSVLSFCSVLDRVRASPRHCVVAAQFQAP